MSHETGPALGVMEGKGAYNKYARAPAGGAAAVALPLWEKAVRCIDLDTGDQAVVIADYGSSQGKNSMVPIQRRCTISRTLLRRPVVRHADAILSM
jgi:hypothetical protein